GAEVGHLLLLLLVALAALHDRLAREQALEGGAGLGERFVVGAVHKVGRDDAALDVAVVAAADAQHVLVGARVVLGGNLGVVQRGLERQRAGLGAGGAVQVE